MENFHYHLLFAIFVHLFHVVNVTILADTDVKFSVFNVYEMETVDWYVPRMVRTLKQRYKSVWKDMLKIAAYFVFFTAVSRGIYGFLADITLKNSISYSVFTPISLLCSDKQYFSESLPDNKHCCGQLLSSSISIKIRSLDLDLRVIRCIIK